MPGRDSGSWLRTGCREKDGRPVDRGGGIQKEARYVGQIKLTTNCPEWAQLIVRVTGVVKLSVAVMPKRLSFGRSLEKRSEQFKKNKRVMRRPVTVVLYRGNDPKIRKMELEKSLYTILVQEKQSAGKCSFWLNPFWKSFRKG